MIDPLTLLVVRTSALGDVIHTLPAVALLRRRWPATEIAWVVEHKYSDLVRTASAVDRVFTIGSRSDRKKGKFGRGPSRLLKMRRELSAFSSGGMAIDFQGLMRSGFLVWLSGASQRTSFAASQLREPLAGMFHNVQLRVQDQQHVVDMNLALAARITGLPPPRATWDLSRFSAENGAAVELLAGRKPVVLNIGASTAKKRWPVDHFITLASELRARGRDVVVAWGPGEEDDAQRVSSAAKVEQLPPTSLRELSTIFQRAAVVVSADTGPLHLAAALGTRVIGLYGPTDVRRNGPYRQLDRCVVSTSGEMAAIRPAVLVKAVDKDLG